MKRKFIIFLLFIFCPLLFLNSKNESPIPMKYKKWLEEEAVYIITSKEEKVFRQLETDKQRDLFIEEFWRQRDPTPGTPQNEFRDEHYRRIEYANRFFGRGTPKPGWKTERGRVYIILGEPIYRQEYIDGRIYPIDLWFYQGGLELESFFYILFFKRSGVGDFELYSPMRDGPPKLCIQTSHEPWDAMGSQKAWNRFFTSGKDASAGGAAYEILYTISIDLAQASLSLIPGGSAINPIESDKLLGKVNVYPQKIVDNEYAYEFLRNKATVEVSYSVHYIGNTSIVKTFQDESDLFFVHYSIQPQNLSVMGYKDKYYSNIQISGRVTDLDGKTVFQYNREYPIDFSKEQIKRVKMIPMTIQDSFPLVPGNYKFSLLLENTVSKEFTSFDKDIIIPEIKESHQMSELVLAYMKEQDQESLKSPFKLGKIIFFPCIRKEFTPKDTLILFFQIYGLREKLNEEGWIIYTFLEKGKNHLIKKKRIRDYQGGKNFIEEFSLKDFPPSIYGLRVSVIENEREILTQEDNFSVSSQSQTKPWIQFKKYPGPGDPIYYFMKGIQLLNKGKMQKAQEELRRAYEMKPGREDFAIAYAQVLLNKEDYREIIKVLNPYAEKSVSDYSLLRMLGRAYMEDEEYEKAINLYQRYISHEGMSVDVLNSVGNCYFQIGNIKEALRAWERSLEINPKQEKIKNLVENIRRWGSLLCLQYPKTVALPET